VSSIFFFGCAQSQDDESQDGDNSKAIKHTLEKEETIEEKPQKPKRAPKTNKRRIPQRAPKTNYKRMNKDIEEFNDEMDEVIRTLREQKKHR
jgi:hypothetical protein